MVDRETMTVKANKYCLILLLTIVAVMITYLSYLTVWIGDDIKYQYNFANLDQRVDNISDVIESQNLHYFGINGRYFAHVLVQSFCGFLGQSAFAIANGVMYVLFFMAIFKLCDVKLSDLKSALSIIVLGLFSFQTKMMPSCQIGYIWMFTFTMWFLIFFFRTGVHSNKWISILCGLLAIIIGNGQEALNIGVSAALLCYWFSHRKEMTLLQYCLMIGFWIGTASNFLSPGSLHRVGSSVGIPIRSFIMLFLKFLLLSRSLWFLIIVVLHQKIKYKIGWRSIYKQNVFYWNCWFALILLNIVVNFIYRAGFGIELLSIIIGIRTLPSKSMNRIWLSLCYLMLAFNVYYQAETILERRAYYQEVTQQYSKSDDGKIYITDLDFYSPIPVMQNFSGENMQHYGVTSGDPTFYYYRWFAHRLKELYPGKPYPVIMPTYLKGKEHVELGNQLLYLGDSLWLAIQSKSEPAKFEVIRGVPILSRVKGYPPVEVDMSDPECILSEGDNWRARFISERDYAIHGINFTKEIKMTVMDRKSGS